MRPRLHVAASRSQQQVPEDPVSAPIRERLGIERQRLDAIAPEALDLASEILASLHHELAGQFARLSADRTPRYRRGQILGEHGLPLEDLCFLYLERPEEVARALRALTTRDEADARRGGLSEAGASMSRAVGGFVGRLLEALGDGVVTMAEERELAQELDQVEGTLRDARAALIRRRV